MWNFIKISHSVQNPQNYLKQTYFGNTVYHHNIIGIHLYKNGNNDQFLGKIKPDIRFIKKFYLYIKLEQKYWYIISTKNTFNFKSNFMKIG